MSATAIAMSDFAKNYKEVKTTEELKEEICLKDLVTKEHFDLVLRKEILELELKINKQTSMAKWQVIGSMFVFFIAGVVAKHFGF